MSVIDELKSKVEKDRQSFAKSLSKSSKEHTQYENFLKTESTKFQAVYEKFCKDQANHLQTRKGKRERTMISEHEKACTDKISKFEESLKKKQDNKTFSVLRKTLGSFLDDGASDEEGAPLDD